MPYQTDERLKNYLDTNQLHREQMCLAILALDRRFTEVRPRHPRGGPDGGRDIEAIFRGEQRTFGAVGFVNQADDSEGKKKEIRAKFRDDLMSALQVTPAPTAFVFLTNVNLTAGVKEELMASGRAKGLVHCEVFDRERLRIALDSADGFATRFQYLGIPLSEAEQASFFAKWGDDINSVIATGFQKVQRTLEHLLFLQESTDPLVSFLVTLELDRAYPADEIGHFRAFCSVYLKEPKLKIFSILFGSSDKSDRFQDDTKQAMREPPGIKFGISGAQWEDYIEYPASSDDSAKEVSNDTQPEKYNQVGSSSSIGMDPVRFISIQYYKDCLIRLNPVISLRDFDYCMFMPMLNSSLAKRVKYIRIFSNGYKLLEVSSDGFQVDDTEFEPSIPVTFNESELTDSWVRIRPKGLSAFRLNFSDEIPHRMFVSRQTRNTLPVRDAGSDDTSG